MQVLAVLSADEPEMGSKGRRGGRGLGWGPVRGAEQAAGLQTRSVQLMAFNPHCSQWVFLINTLLNLH